MCVFVDRLNEWREDAQSQACGLTLGVCLCLGPARSKGLREVTSYSEIRSLPPSQVPRLSALGIQTINQEREENVKRHRCAASTLRVEETCSSLSFSLIIATIPGGMALAGLVSGQCSWTPAPDHGGSQGLLITQGCWVKGMDFWKRRTRTTWGILWVGGFLSFLSLLLWLVQRQPARWPCLLKLWNHTH